MEMFLMAMALSVAAALVSGVLLLFATRVEAVAPLLSPAIVDDEERFFMWPPAAPRAGAGDALVLQIERHVQLERAVVEAFLQLPTVETLRARTLSPLAR